MDGEAYSYKLDNSSPIITTFSKVYLAIYGVIFVQMVSNSIGVFTKTSLHISKVIPIQHPWEILLNIFYNLLQSIKYLLWCKLHDFSIEIDNPNDLFLFLEDPLANMYQSLICISGKLIIIEHFMQLVYFNIANSVHYYRLPVFVLTAYSVLVHLFYTVDPLSVEIVLDGWQGTSC